MFKYFFFSQYEAHLKILDEDDAFGLAILQLASPFVCTTTEFIFVASEGKKE